MCHVSQPFRAMNMFGILLTSINDCTVHNYTVYNSTLKTQFRLFLAEHRLSGCLTVAVKHNYSHICTVRSPNLRLVKLTAYGGI